MRILWGSNAPWAPSGYGSQTLQVVKRLIGDGHQVAIAANFGVQAMIAERPDLPGVPILPALYDGIGNDILPAHYHAWAQQDGGAPTQLITLYDVWPYQRDRFTDIPVASWVPIDHYPAPPQVVEWCREHRPIAMSRFGQRTLAEVGIEADYVPHAIELDVFQPGDKAIARDELQWPRDAFVVLINAANKGSTPMRKAWDVMLQAISMLMKRHEDVRLHLHTERLGAQAPDLGYITASYSIPEDRLGWTPQYLLKVGQIKAADVARMYRAADVLLATSMGEGFGIPVIEAQACGLPVIVSDFSAQPELVGGGWLVNGQLAFDPIQSANFFTPWVPFAADALEVAYGAKDDPDIRARAIAKAAEYDADTVYAEHWRPLLAQLEADLVPRPARKGKSRGSQKRARRAA